MTVSNKAFGAITIILIILLADQTIKIWIKTHFLLGQEESITNWFSISFIENKGMAMGIEVFGKLFLTIFRLVASVAIFYYIYVLIRNNFKLSYILLVSMIFAGAVGNIIDSVFYGVIFNESTPKNIAVLFPPEGGYGSWLHGDVVDMFRFRSPGFTWPSWMPWIGGSEFFPYIFNLADASISVGIVVLLLFFRKSLSLSLDKQEVET